MFLVRCVVREAGAGFSGGWEEWVCKVRVMNFEMRLSNANPHWAFLGNGVHKNRIENIWHKNACWIYNPFKRSRIPQTQWNYERTQKTQRYIRVRKVCQKKKKDTERLKQTQSMYEGSIHSKSVNSDISIGIERVSDRVLKCLLFGHVIGTNTSNPKMCMIMWKMSIFCLRSILIFVSILLDTSSRDPK